MELGQIVLQGWFLKIDNLAIPDLMSAVGFEPTTTRLKAASLTPTPLNGLIGQIVSQEGIRHSLMIYLDYLVNPAQLFMFHVWLEPTTPAS